MSKIRYNQHYVLDANQRLNFVKRRQDVAVESWIDMAIGGLSHPDFGDKKKAAAEEAVPIMFNMIATFEEHPPMLSGESVDYVAIYQAISLLMRGEVPRDMNLATERKMMEITRRMYRELNEPSLHGSIREAKKKLAGYTFEPTLAENDLGWEDQHLLIGCNVFNFPQEMFIRGACITQTRIIPQIVDLPRCK